MGPLVRKLSAMGLEKGEVVMMINLGIGMDRVAAQEDSAEQQQQPNAMRMRMGW